MKTKTYEGNYIYVCPCCTISWTSKTIYTLHLDTMMGRIQDAIDELKDEVKK